MTAPPPGAATPRRRWLVPEVVQTSTMDCGPAALKALAEGFGIPVSYGRLREACQTGVDGTSIDTLERVANQLGVAAEQVMIPADHLLLPSAAALPAIVVVQHPGGGTHFVVAWRCVAGRVQVMDPATGRRWVARAQFLDEVFRHETAVPAAGWREWAATEAFLAPLRDRMAAVGVAPAEVERLLSAALGDPGWFGLGALDAAVRLIGAVVAAGGLARGAAASRLLGTLFADTTGSTGDIHRVIPPGYWSVAPDPTSPDRARQRLLLRGAVLVRATGRSEAAPDAEPLPPELAAALAEPPARPMAALWSLLRQDGLARPLALAAAMVLAVGVVLVESLLFRGLFDIADMLALGSQRLAAMGVLLVFVAALMLLEIPIASESMRLGRHLEARLRMALLRKLPLLPDRYLHSRPISDMADRAHALQLVRLIPGMAVHLLQAACELVLTLAGILLIAPGSAGFAVALGVAAVAVPAAVQASVNERDLRMRNHAGALGGFYLDALLGLVPVRAHRAQRAMRRAHEALLVEWARAGRRLFGLSALADAGQALLCLGLAGALLAHEFLGRGQVSGSDLLLVYWVLKLPAIGATLTALAHQYPMQRNVVLRLLEPLQAPEEMQGASEAVAPEGPVSIAIEGGTVLAGGHVILEEVSLAVAAGEHVAVVGESGAGKSSLLGLLLGWHRLAEGTLQIDGAEPDAGAVQALRHATAWVDPAVQIWNRSLAENLGYSSADGGGARIGAALREAELRSVLRTLPDGLQTRLGEGGALLSGGEGQRVRLGRAFVQPAPRLVLLDEPFRGLDRERRGALLEGARDRWRGVTLLCVTHDIGETRGFDRVLVVESGRIAQDGPPARLAAEPGRYAELLAAEQALRGALWSGPGWRRLTLREGRVDEG